MDIRLYFPSRYNPDRPANIQTYNDSPNKRPPRPNPHPYPGYNSYYW